jgi:hypothetical protein
MNTTPNNNKAFIDTQHSQAGSTTKIPVSTAISRILNPVTASSIHFPHPQPVTASSTQLLPPQPKSLTSYRVAAPTSRFLGSTRRLLSPDPATASTSRFPVPQARTPVFSSHLQHLQAVSSIPKPSPASSSHLQHPQARCCIFRESHRIPQPQTPSSSHNPAKSTLPSRIPVSSPRPLLLPPSYCILKQLQIPEPDSCHPRQTTASSARIPVPQADHALFLTNSR